MCWTMDVEHGDVTEKEKRKTTENVQRVGMTEEYARDRLR